LVNGDSGDVKIKQQGLKKKVRRKNFDYDEPVEKAMKRFPQLNKFYQQRALHGFGPR
jgi:hypothetical protein